MKTLSISDLRKVFKDRLGAYEEKMPWRTGVLGDGRGNAASNLFVPGTDNHVWARASEQSREYFPVLNRNGAPAAIGLPVVIGYRIGEPTQEQVLGINYDGMPVGTLPGGGQIGPHHTQHEFRGGDEVFIDGRLFLPGLVTPTTPRSMQVTISQFVYYWNDYRLFTGATSDNLSRYLPKSGFQVYVLIALDPATGNIVYRPGLPYSSASIEAIVPTFSVVPSPSGDEIPLAYILIYDDTTTLDWTAAQSNIFDGRLHTGIPFHNILERLGQLEGYTGNDPNLATTGAAGSSVANNYRRVQDLSDVSVVGLSNGQALAYEQATNRWVPTTVAGGVAAASAGPGDVASSSAIGTGASYALHDHIHRGVVSVNVPNNNFIHGAVNVVAGTNITLTQSSGSITINSTASGSSAAAHSYYNKLAAMLEPDAIVFKGGQFSHTIGASETLLMTASWSTRIGDNGRMEVRDPRSYLPLRGITVKGSSQGTAAIFINPSLPSYSDARGTYFSRLDTLAESTPKYISFSAASQVVPLLPGAYGAIIVRSVLFDLTWLSPQISSSGFNLSNEPGDNGNLDYQRNDNAMTLAVNKACIADVIAGQTKSGLSPLGTIVYHLVGSAWGVIPDSTAYDFRDDFMGASLNTATSWARQHSSATNVEIDTNYGWLRMSGTASWGANALHSQVSVGRDAGQIFQCDVYTGLNQGDGAPNLMVGFNTGLGFNDQHMVHAVDFTSVSAINIFENGNNRGTVGVGWERRSTYRVRITLGSAASNAKYEIQGGKYQPFGGSAWTDISPGTTTASNFPLYAGATIHSINTVYLSDMKMY
jgi:hypothetical protein